MGNVRIAEATRIRDTKRLVAQTTNENDTMASNDLNISIGVQLDPTEALAQAKKIERDIQRLTGAKVDIPVELSGGTQAKNELKSIADEAQKTAKSADSISDSFTQVTKALNKSLAEQKRALSELSRSGKQNTAEYTRLLKSLTATKTELTRVTKVGKDAGEQIDKAFANATQEVGTFKSAVQGIADTVNISAIAEGLQGGSDALVSFAERGLEVQQALSLVQAQTGKTGDEIEALQRRAEDAFRKGVGESVSEAIKTLSSAEQLLGGVFDGEGVAEFATGASAVAKVLDTDVNEVLLKSTNLIKNFGLDADEAFNLVALGARDAKTAQDDVLDTIAEYSGFFNKAGVSAEQFINALTVGAEEGALNTDQIADSIKEASIRLNAGDITRALDTIRDDAQKTGNTIADTLAQSVQAVVTSGENGTLELKDVLIQANAEIEKAFANGDIPESIRQQFQVAVSGTRAEEIGTEIFSRVVEGFAQVDFSGDIAEQITSAFAGVPQELQSEFTLITDAVSNGFTDASGALAQSLEAVNTAFAQGSIGQELRDQLIIALDPEAIAKQAELVGESVSKAIAPVSFGQTLAKEFEIFSTSVVGFLSPVANSLGTVLGTVSQFAPALQALKNLDIPQVTKAFDVLGKAGSKAMTLLTGKLGIIIAAIGAVTAAVTYAYQNFEPFRVAVDDVFGFITAVFDELKPAFEEIGNFVVEFGSLWLEFVITPFEIAYEVISGVIGVVVDLVSELFDLGDGAETTASFMDTLGDAVEFVVLGFKTAGNVLRGVKSAFVAIKDGIKTAIDALTSGNIVDAFKAFVGIGDNAIEAFKDGFTTLPDAVEEGTQKALEAGTDALSDHEKELVKQYNKLFGATKDFNTALTNEEKKRLDEALKSIRKSNEQASAEAVAQAKKASELLAKIQSETDKQIADTRIASIEDTRDRELAVLEEKEKAIRKESADATEEILAITREGSEKRSQLLEALAEREKAKLEEIEREKRALRTKFAEEDAKQAQEIAEQNFKLESELLRRYAEERKSVTVEELKQRQNAENALAQIQFQNQQERLQKELQAVEQQIKALDTLDSEKAKALLKRQELLNKQILAEQEAFAREEAQRTEAQAKESANARIRANILAIEDENKRINELNKLSAKQRYEEQLRANEGNLDAQRKAYIVYLQELEQLNRQFIATQDFAGAFAQNLGDALLNFQPENVNAELEEEARERVQIAESEAEELEQLRKKGLISFEEYQRRLTQVQAEQEEARTALAEAETSVLEQVQRQLADSFASSYETQTAQFAELTNERILLAQRESAIENELRELGLRADEEANERRKELFEERKELLAQEEEVKQKQLDALVSAQTSAFAELIVAGELNAQNTLKLAADTAKKLIDIYAPQIIGLFQSIIPPPFGFLAGTSAVIALKALVASATAGFRDGVIDLQGAGTETSDSIPARLSKGESVMTAKETRKYKDVLQAIRDGKTREQVGQMLVDKRGSVQLHTSGVTTDALIAEVRELKNSMQVHVKNDFSPSIKVQQDPRGLFKQVQKGQARRSL